MNEKDLIFASRSESARWDEMRLRFRMALMVARVKPRVHDYYPGWVLGYIKPTRFSQAGVGQVEGCLQKLAGVGKEICR